MHFGWSWRSNRVDKCRVASGGLIVLIGMASRWIQSSSRGDNFKLYIVQMSEQRSQFRKLFLVQVTDEEKISAKFSIGILLSDCRHFFDKLC